MTVNSGAGAGVEALLGEKIVPLAAATFVATFAGVGLGRERARNRVDKELHRRFGKPRGSDAHHAYQAVILQIVLIWERAGVAARAHSGVLILLPDGARLLDATDVADKLRALL
ncbi:hypothetical protein [Streptomyces sp. NBC_01803]|uniref:hypothetical protein n=1 Tax=Streptomyces sp. NBC_01803 TaxID=2975946 RepID=UPI002DDB8960|nr:hypothetical protein [Streptomyces sp. NBC_01803]WSA43025.1 hypothetical protein OIE51_01735 [Streptomyces sp. NBC_01803]